MILKASDTVQEHVDKIISLRRACCQDAGKWVSLHPDLTLSDIKSIERLYVKFTKLNKDFKYPGRIKMCYKYAFQASMRDKNLIYCEGLAINKNIPLALEHAWCVHKDTGEVVDTVWKNKHQGIGYSGIPLAGDFINKVLARAGTYGVIPNLHLSFFSCKLKDIVHHNFHSLLYEQRNANE
jgi:hypothetical protein